MRKILLYVFLTSSFLFSNIASAVDYYWYFPSITSLGQFDSPSKACAAAWATYAGVTFTEIVYQTDSRVACNYKQGAASGGPILVRSGTTCTPPRVYDAATRSCITPPDPCLSTNGQIVVHEFAFRSLDAAGNPDTDPPASICNDSNHCQYSHDFGAFEIPSYRDGNRPNKIIGKFNYKGNGMSCTGGAGGSNFDQPPSKPPMSPEPTKLTDNSCSSWSTGADGVSRRTCTGTDFYNNPGNLKCGTGPAGYTCVESKPTPYSKDEDVSKSDEKTTNPDGSKTDKSTTTTTITTCKGMNACTTTSKTEVTNNGTNSDGTPGNTSSTCNGTGCSSSGSSAGSPTGSGDEEGNDEEEEEGESPTVTPITKPTENGTFDDAIADWDEKINQSKDDIKDAVERLGDEFSGGINLASGGGSLYCGDSVQVLGQTINMCLNDYSSQLSMISTLLLFMGAFIALYIVFK